MLCKMIRSFENFVQPPVRYSVNSGIVLLSLSSILIAAAQISVTYCISIYFYLYVAWQNLAELVFFLSNLIPWI